MTQQPTHHLGYQPEHDSPVARLHQAMLAASANYSLADYDAHYFAQDAAMTADLVVE